MTTLDLLDTEKNAIDDAILDTFRELHGRWPRSFSRNTEPKVFAIWRDTLTRASVPHALWVAVAQEVTRTWPPGPPPSNIEFRDEAVKHLSRAHPVTAAVYGNPAPPLSATASDLKKDRLIRRAYDTLGSYWRAAEVMALALSEATTEAQRDALHAGDIADTQWDAYIERIRNE